MESVMTTVSKRRVAVYIDGFNLYFGLVARGWRKYLWLDLEKFAASLILTNQMLVHIKYFTSRISGPVSKQRRQSIFLDALATLPGVSIYYGRYQNDTKACPACKALVDTPHEKKTDVNIATEMLVDAFQGAFDTAILVTADSDLTAPIVSIRRLFPDKAVVVAFPPKRSSDELKRVASAFFTIARPKFASSQFPDKGEWLKGWACDNRA
jgi:uncharacterized LabA/DUF88 family protein